MRTRRFASLVLTGTGRSFSSGYNIGRLGGGSSDGGFERLTDKLERFRCRRSAS